MESEIAELINAGWKPRIKTKKNRRYITIRRGNKEKSLGPFTEKLWDEIKPVDPWATPSQISELEKRIGKLEEKQREPDPSFNTLFLNFEKMRGELLVSARRRLMGNTACKNVDKNGVCNWWHFSRNSGLTAAYLGPMKRGEYKDKIIYRVRVREHPLFCSACPEYERKS